MTAPTELGRRENRALVVWWSDGGCSEYDLRTLRLSCPCAVCVNEWTGEKILNPEKVPQGVRPLRLFSVGRYALGIEWSDGHSTGLYSYDYLRGLSGANPGAPG